MQFHNIQIKNEKAEEVVGIRLPKAEKEISSSIKELAYIGEEKNQNIRTRVEAPHEAGLQLKEGDKRLLSFKEKAEKSFRLYEKNKESLSAELLKGLEEEGVSAEDSDSTLIEKNVKNILENREKKRENLEKQVEELSNDRKEIEKIAVSLSVGGEAAIRDRLTKSGLPVTKANMEKLSSGMALADKVLDGLDEASIYHAIKKEEPQTLENLLKSEELPTPNVKADFLETEALWEKMKPQADKLLFEQGVEKTKETEVAAKWLFERGLPVLAENIARFESLQILKNGAKEAEVREEIYDELAKKMAEGEPILKTEIGTEKKILAKQSIYYFKTVVEQKAIYKEVSARRQIEEIRLKLTEEVAVKMLKKGITINVTDLKGLVENLRKEEESYFEAFTEGERGPEAETLSINRQEKKEESGADIMKMTLSVRSFHFRMNEDSEYKYKALSFAYQREERISLRAYHKAGLAYEEGSTEIRADLGDSMKKAVSDIDSFLKRSGFEETEENRRAAKRLLYSKAEINETSLMKMKTVSLLVDEVFEEMKPATVARLIKNGENPLDLSMEELYEKLKAINEEIKPAEERFSSYLFKLEKQGGMDEEERKAYIGMYRLLSQIEKGDGAAIAGVSLAEKALTFRNMLEMIRTRKLGGFDKKIEEGLGELTSTLSENRIDTQIESAFLALSARKLMREAEKPEKEYFEEKEESIKDKQIQQTDVEKLLETGEKISISTAVAQMEVRGGRKSLKSFLLGLSEEEKTEITESATSFLEALSEEEKRENLGKKLNQKLIEKAEEGLETEESFEGIKNLIGIKNTLSLSLKRVDIETYDLPIFYEEDKLADLQLTVRKARGGEEKGKIEIRLFFEETEVNVSLRLAGNRLSALFFAEDRESLDRLGRQKEDFSELIKELELSEGEITYHLQKFPTVFLESDDIYSGSTETKKLYQIAKKVSSHLLKGLGIRK